VPLYELYGESALNSSSQYLHYVMIREQLARDCSA